MTTITYRRGSQDQLGFRPVQPDGTAPDLAGAQMQLRIEAPAACLPLDGAAEGDVFFVELSQLDLPPRLYRAAVWLDWGDGWMHEADLLINIQGGC